jgi:hypothetical protein
MAIIEIAALSIFSASLVFLTTLLFVHNNDLNREHISSTHEYSNIDDASNGKPFVK